MTIAVRAEREGDRARLVPVGAFDVAHAPAVAKAVAHVSSDLEACRSIDVDLTHLDRIDGAGAVLLARLLDRLDANGNRTRMVEDRNPEAARLITLYRQKREEPPPARFRCRPCSQLIRLRIRAPAVERVAESSPRHVVAVCHGRGMT